MFDIEKPLEEFVHTLIPSVRPTDPWNHLFSRNFAMSAFIFFNDGL